MSELDIEIQELLEQGLPPVKIAEMLEIPINWVTYHVDEDDAVLMQQLIVD